MNTNIFKFFRNIFLFTLILTVFTSISQDISYNYICPVPGSIYINPEQNIILRTGMPFDKTTILKEQFSISGELSEMNDFQLILSADGITLIIKPLGNFIYGETVTFISHGGIQTVNGGLVTPLTFSFMIKEYDNRPLLSAFKEREAEDEESQLFNNLEGKGIQAPDKTRDNNLPADFPPVTTIQYGFSGEDYYFLAQNDRGGGGRAYSNYLTICDRFGTPIYFKKMNQIYLNFCRLPNGTLAYARHALSYPENEKYFIMDSSYYVLDSIRTGNGYDLDCHDILLLNDGHYLVMSYDPQIVDMSLIVPGGKPNATVIGLIIQEVDDLENVFFQWRSWDHFEITDATSDINLTGLYIDYVHGNAIDLALDGNILLSSRNMDEITKINFGTGDIIWRFGPLAENNEFIVNNDPYGFTHQHDIRMLPNGNITVFDNGNLRTPNFSQGLEYQINEITRVATRVWSYRHIPDIFAPATGSHRRYSNGISLIGWGGSWPVAGTEVNLFGTKMLEIFLPDTITSYRCLKYSWKTNRFSSLENLHMGNVIGNGESDQSILPVTNNSSTPITISSYHSLSDTFSIITELPITISPGTTQDMIIGFQPEGNGDFEDILTLNYDNYNLNYKERIAIQIKLFGIADSTLPVVTFTPEFNATDVDPYEPVFVFFSEPVRKEGGGEITDSDIPDLFYFKHKDQLGDPVTFSGHITTDKKLITLTPDLPLLNFIQYYIEMKADTLEDYQGQVLNYPEVTIFTTGDYVSAEEKMVTSQFQVSPSPFGDYIQITASGAPVSSVKIFDITSNIVANIECNEGSVKIDTKHLASGIYILRVVSDEVPGTWTARVVKL